MLQRIKDTVEVLKNNVTDTKLKSLCLCNNYFAFLVICLHLFPNNFKHVTVLVKQVSYSEIIYVTFEKKLIKTAICTYNPLSYAVNNIR